MTSEIARVYKEREIYVRKNARVTQSMQLAHEEDVKIMWEKWRRYAWVSEVDYERYAAEAICITAAWQEAFHRGRIGQRTSHAA